MDSDKLVPGLLQKAGANFIEAITDKRANDKAVFYFLLFLLLLILVVGTEPPKLIFRRRMGKFTLGYFSIFLSAITFGICSYLLFLAIHDTRFHLGKSHEQEFLFAGALLYAGLTIWIIVRAFAEFFRTPEILNFYRGESVYFKPLLEGGYKQETIWTVIEPSICLTAGILFYILHPYIGIPIILSSISFGFNEIYQVRIIEARRKESHARMEIKNGQPPVSSLPKDEFYPVNHNNNQSTGL